MKVLTINKARLAQQLLDTHGEPTMLHYFALIWPMALTSSNEGSWTCDFRDDSKVSFHNDRNRPHYHFTFDPIHEHTAPADAELCARINPSCATTILDPNRARVAAAVLEEARRVIAASESPSPFQAHDTTVQHHFFHVNPDPTISLAAIRADAPAIEPIIEETTTPLQCHRHIPSPDDVALIALAVIRRIDDATWEQLIDSVRLSDQRARYHGQAVLPIQPPHAVKSIC